MRALSVLLVVLAGVPSLSNATSNFSVESVICSGSQTSNIGEVVTLSCTGDFSLIGGSISADTKLLISSVGKLTLDNLFISAPDTEFVAGTIWYGPGVSIESKGSAISFPGRDIGPRVGSGVPNNTNGGTIAIGGSGVSLNNIDPHRVNEDGGALAGGTITLTPSSSGNGGGTRVLSGNSYPVTGGATMASLSPVPEPSAYASMLAGLLVLAGFLRAKKRRAA